MLKTTAQIEAEVESIEATLLNETEGANIDFLNASKDALLWALGERTDSPTEANR